MAPDDFVMTLESDDEGTPTSKPARATKSNADADDLKMNEEFNFDFTGDTYADLWVNQASPSDVVKSGTKPVSSELWFCLMSVLS
jgi:ATP-dependent RNA helicase DDX27